MRRAKKEHCRSSGVCSSLGTESGGGVQNLWFDVRPSNIPNSGRGVFAKRSFDKGDLVMSAPILIFNKSEIDPQGTISRYCGNIKPQAFMCFDYQGLCNTSPDPKMNNVRATWRIKDDRSEYFAIKNIEIGDEILQEYKNPIRIN